MTDELDMINIVSQSDQTLSREVIDQQGILPLSQNTPFLEVDLKVSRAGPLGVRLRYHRLLSTPFLSTWEAYNYPNAGPLLETIQTLDKSTAPFIPDIGDALVSVDGHSLIGLSLEESVAVIRKSAMSGSSRIFRIRKTSDYERAHVDGKASVLKDSSNTSGQSGISRLDSFNMSLGGSTGLVDDTDLRSLAAGGCPEETGVRGIVWRYLLDQLPKKRSDWPSHLERERSLYHSFANDLFKDKGTRKNLHAAASLASESTLVNESMYDIPVKDTLTSEDTTWVACETAKQEDTGNDIKQEGTENDAKQEDTENAQIEGTENDIKQEDTENDAKLEDTENDIKQEDTENGQIEGDAKSEDDFDADEFLLYEISKDVVRTHPDLQFFLDAVHGPARYESLKRVLFVYAKLNPGVKYVQGMNELLGALFYVLAAQSPQVSESEELSQLFSAQAAEADAFNCFTVLMGELRDVFVEDLDDSTTGIKGRMAAIDSLLGHHDPELHGWLTALGVDPTFYTLRWITTLLSREFDLPDTLRLWDAFLSERGMRAREIWLAYFCVSMIIGIRSELLVADFGGAINALQAYPPSAPSIERLLEVASDLRSQDQSMSNSRSTSWPFNTRSLSESMNTARPMMTDLRAKASQSAAALAAKAGGSASVMADSVGAARSWWASRRAPSMSADSIDPNPPMTSSPTSSYASDTSARPSDLVLDLAKGNESEASSVVEDHEEKGVDEESDDEFEDVPLSSPSVKIVERW